MTFRNDIQGLRAFSFIFVFIFHINEKWLPGGFLGVDLFFVISGFLMTQIIYESINQKKFSFVKFYINRIKRIIPAYYFFILITALASSYIYLYTDLDFLKQSIISSLFFYSNTYFSKAGSYFGASSNENPFLHTWSLAIEMQFYFLLPLILFYFKKNLKTVLILSIIILSTYSSYKIFFGRQTNSMYFSLFARIPEFIIGGVLGLAYKNGLHFGKIKNNIITFLCVIILIACLVKIDANVKFPGIIALTPCLACAIILITKDNLVSSFLSKKPFVFIGELSYSLYLWHFPIIALMRYKNDSYFFNFKDIIIICLLTFILAYLSYSFIEKKLKKIKTNIVLVVLISTCFITYCYSLGLKKMFISHEIPNNYSSRKFGIESHNNLYIQKLGEQNRNDKILLIGDSHAWSLKLFFHEIGKKNKFSFKTLTSDSYPALEGILEEDIIKNERDGLVFYYNSQKLVKTTKKLIDESEVIIISIIGIKRPESVYTAIEKVAINLKKHQKLILINSYPTLQKNPLKMNNGFIKNNFTRIEFEDTSETKKQLKKIASKYRNVFIYNINTDLIKKDPGYINDTVIYYDRRHINEFGAKRLIEEHESNIAKLLLQ